ncbi:hypothetical protein [Marinimicrobium sp. ABcell2]|uniref:hypothetical protein n=1 Tax=Marinimicrobium sp. ABcell2 TaxID=3069751 RepID=UPI0027AF1317|nr:hypothetical protein [Marinimicrobium sp. ABcell2]MDQ2075241.1 hypothetical protein [Marinimicrobium sp. ABcell2]
MPQAKYDYSNTALSAAALALTSDLLRHHNPSLAEVVHNALANIKEAPPGRRTGIRVTQPPLNAALISSLEAETVGQVLAALTDLGNRALEDHEDPEQLKLVHRLLEDWVSLADWLLRCTDNRPSAFH